VQSCVVEPAEVFDDRELELGSCSPDAVGDQFGLEAVDERFCERVVVRVPDRSDGSKDAVVVEGFP